MIRDKDGKPGLRFETAASVTLRDTIAKHMQVFAEAIRTDRTVGQDVIAVYIDGLAGAVALVVRGPYGTGRLDVTESTIKKLQEAITRDLAHLAGIITVK